MRARQKASFATQYTSLMLIILSVVVASRFELDMHSQAYAIESARIKPQFTTISFGVMNYQDLFIPGEDRVSEDAATAIASIVSQHDVNARLSIYLPVEELSGDKSKALGLGLARAVSARSYFTDITPEGSIHIEVLEEPGGTLAEAHQASVQFASAQEGAHGE